MYAYLNKNKLPVISQSIMCLFIVLHSENGIIISNILFTDVIISPTPVNVSLGAEDASFGCLAIGHHVNWLQNGSSIDHGPGQKFDVTTVLLNEPDHLRMSTLTVNMSLVQIGDNSTNFVCVASIGHFLDISNPALFLTQGMNYMYYWSSICTCIQVHWCMCVCCLRLAPDVFVPYTCTVRSYCGKAALH